MIPPKSAIAKIVHIGVKRAKQIRLTRLSPAVVAELQKRADAINASLVDYIELKLNSLILMELELSTLKKRGENAGSTTSSKVVKSHGNAFSESRNPQSLQEYDDRIENAHPPTSSKVVKLHGNGFANAANPQSSQEVEARIDNSGSTPRFKGVYRYGKRWAAVLCIDGKKTRLGVFDLPEDAARAYDNACVARWGTPNAAINFPGPLDEATAKVLPFIEQLAHGLTDEQWREWGAPPPVIETQRSPAPRLTPLPRGLRVAPTETVPFMETLPVVPINDQSLNGPLVEVPEADSKPLYNRREPPIPTTRQPSIPEPDE